MGLRNLLHTLELFEPRLRLARLARLSPKAAHEILDVGDATLLFFVLCLLLGALALVIRVATSVGVRACRAISSVRSHVASIKSRSREIISSVPR